MLCAERVTSFVGSHLDSRGAKIEAPGVIVAWVGVPWGLVTHLK